MRKKLGLNSICFDLEIGALPNTGVLNELCCFLAHHNLPLHFDTPLYGAKVSDGAEEIINEQGDIEKVILAGESILLPHGAKAFTPDENGMDSTEGITVVVFNYNGADYYSTNKVGMFIEPTSLNYREFYCLEEDLKTLIKNKSGNAQTTNSRPKLKGEQRADALEELIKEDINNELPNLSRHGVWMKLNEKDPSLFPLRDDPGAPIVKSFFRVNSGKINFKRGRPSTKIPK